MAHWERKAVNRRHLMEMQSVTPLAKRNKTLNLAQISTSKYLPTYRKSRWKKKTLTWHHGEVINKNQTMWNTIGQRNQFLQEANCKQTKKRNYIIRNIIYVKRDLWDLSNNCSFCIFFGPWNKQTIFMEKNVIYKTMILLICHKCFISMSCMKLGILARYLMMLINYCSLFLGGTMVLWLCLKKIISYVRDTN